MLQHDAVYYFIASMVDIFIQTESTRLGCHAQEMCFYQKQFYVMLL